MRTNLLSSRLAAKTGIRQAETLAMADEAGAAADRAIGRVWRELLRVLKTKGLSYFEVKRRVEALLRRLPEVVTESLGKRLVKIAEWGHRSAVDAVAEVLPVDVIQAATLSEAAPMPFGRGMAALMPGGKPVVNPAAARLTWPADPGKQREEFAKLLMPAPKALDVFRAVFASGWRERIASLSRLAAPHVLASSVATSMALGKTPQQIAKELLPHVGGVRSAARRVARTEGMRIAHDTQDRAWGELGDMVVGFQIHAQLDQHTRPWHALRNGVIYYKNPKPGQKGLEQMPSPPEEPDDPAERPPGTPKVAPNCRCWKSPVLQNLDDVESSPAKRAVFTDASRRMVPDPSTYSEWWSKADRKRQILAVGARRYNTLEQATGRELAWADFLDPETGDLLTVGQLQAETPAQRAIRRAKVDALIAERKELIREALTFGFIPSGAPGAGMVE